ncbi:MAG: ABC transporter substrate-binding protein [Alphaproteobacteria bacterium]|nr:ABC transporter substrate-binding protein [Alphaproteobacteria bacterium]
MKARLPAAWTALALAATLAAIAPARAAEPGKVVITQSNDGFLYGPLHIARARGYLREEGVDAEVIVMGGGAKAMSAVLSGSAHIYVGAPFELINAAERGQRVKAFAEIVDRVMISLVLRSDVAARIGIAADSPVPARIAAMKGLKLGISSPKSSGEALYRNLLRQGRLDADRDADIVPVGSGSAALAAFIAAKVDVYTFSSPFKEQAVERGPGVVLFDMSAGEVAGYASYPYISLIARDDWLDGEPAKVGGVVRAIAKAMAFLHADRAGARAVLREVFSKLDEPIFETAFAANMRSYARCPDIDPGAFETALAEYRLVAGKEATVGVDRLATNRYAAAALAARPKGAPGC